jgi:glutamate dehydrogenase
MIDRITGADIRSRVIGEGANLGHDAARPRRGAMRGIRLNTDAIDNSAGVNTSDVEVNLKIALATPMRDGRISREGRNALLAAMTDEVAALVLRNNYLQPLAISLAELRGLEDLGFEQRLMQTLETAGELDRAVEFLPTIMEIAERRRRSQALTRPSWRCCWPMPSSRFTMNCCNRTCRMIPISAASWAAISPGR